MRTFNKFLAMAITFGCALAIIVAVSSLFWDGRWGGSAVDFKDIEPLIAVGLVMLVAFIICIVECVRHRKDPKPEKAVLLVRTSGIHFSGLPCAGTPIVEIKLYRDKFVFGIWQDVLSSKQQTVTLDINKVNNIQKSTNTLSSGAISNSATQFVNIATNGSKIRGYMTINYTSDGEDKQIVFGIPLLVNVNGLIKQFEILKPGSNSPIEL